MKELDIEDRFPTTPEIPFLHSPPDWHDLSSFRRQRAGKDTSREPRNQMASGGSMREIANNRVCFHGASQMSEQRQPAPGGADINLSRLR
ncbi:hypothetical protein, partial [Mesorhizobium sp. M2D.F.Ca.ET.223.01.1.1]|uniref:hypothetical protein n=1 Tax=Mesorhizobium sp. M2D.F.Ca.ET.223.01.1.1 TaxID=2563940 RepID=UPI001AEF279C